MSFNLTIQACSYGDLPFPTQHILESRPVAHWLLGDPVYHQLPWVQYSVTIPGTVLASLPAEWKTRFEDTVLAKNSMRDLFALRALGTRIYLVWDDHGWGGDNWDHTLAKANTSNPIGASTLADVLLHWQRGTAGQLLTEAAYADNPLPGAPNGNIPSAMVGTASASDYPKRYFYQDFGSGGQIGGALVRTITPDCISYKSPVGDTDNLSKTMLGAEQLAEVNALILDATTKGYKHICLMLSKDPFNIDNSDGWFRYSTERDNWFAYLHSINAPVAVMSGDRHTPHVGVAAIAAGHAYDMVTVCPCSFSVPLDTLTNYDQNVWQAKTNSDHVFGRVAVDEVNKQVRYAIVDALTGIEKWGGSIAFGSRKLI